MSIRQSKRRKIKNLMRHRTTLEQGLTARQIFNELHADLVEQYHDQPSASGGKSELDLMYLVYGRNRVLQLVTRLRNSDDEFRWLCPVPLQDGRGKIREYRYVNLKPGNDTSTEGYRLLDESLDRKEKWNKTHEKRIQRTYEINMRSEEERAQLHEIELARRRLRKFEKEERERKAMKKVTDGKIKKKGFGITEPVAIEFLGRIHSSTYDDDERMIF